MRDRFRRKVVEMSLNVADQIINVVPRRSKLARKLQFAPDTDLFHTNTQRFIISDATGEQTRVAHLVQDTQRNFGHVGL